MSDVYPRATLKDGTRLVRVPGTDRRAHGPSWCRICADTEPGIVDSKECLYVHDDVHPPYFYWVEDSLTEAPATTDGYTDAERGQALILPQDKQARKEMPIARGVVDYFPRALAAIAHVSYVANEQHNPGEPMHWARGKSTDHADCIVRHLIERGRTDDDGLKHSAKMAWRALALLEEELEAEAAEATGGSRVAG